MLELGLEMLELLFGFSVAERRELLFYCCYEGRVVGLEVLGAVQGYGQVDGVARVLCVLLLLWLLESLS